eukprot:1001118-Alexandrium_andersonii.AAC.1
MEALRGACRDLGRASGGRRSRNRPGRRHRALEPREGALDLIGLASPSGQARAADGSEVRGQELATVRCEAAPGLLGCKDGSTQARGLLNKLGA